MSKVVVLGNGPSLRGFDFTSIKMDSIGMNAAYRYWDKIGWYPTYYCCLDFMLIQTHHQEIKRLYEKGLIKKILVRSSFLQYHPEYKNDPNVQIWENLFHHICFRNHCVTTGSHSIRWAAYLGYKDIYILGIDAKYQEFIPESEKIAKIQLRVKETPKYNPNYFFDDYQRAGDVYHQPNPDFKSPTNNLHVTALRQIAKEFKERNFKDINIWNCNKESIIFSEKIFPYKPFEEVNKEETT